MRGPRKLSRRLRLVLVALAGAVVLYGAAGFLLVPWIVKKQIVKEVGKLVDRPVSVEKVAVNPFALTLTVERFLVQDRDGSRLASFDRLYVDADFIGLLRKQVGVKEFALDRPYVHGALDARGELNVADILRRLSAADGKPPTRRDESGVVFAVRLLRIAEAQIDFTDLSRRRPFTTTAGPVTLELKNFKTRREEGGGAYAFSGRTESGERFSWRGNVGIEPIRSKGAFAFEDLALPKYAPYYQDATSAEIRSGVLRLEASYDLEWGNEARRVKIVEGAMALTNLVVGPRDGGAAPIELPRFEVSGVHADVLTRDASISRVAIQGGRIRITRGKDGALDLVALLAPPAGEAQQAEGVQPGVAPAGKLALAREPRVELGEVLVEGLRIDATDEVPEVPVSVFVEVARASVAKLSNDPAGQATLDAQVRVNGKGQVSARGTLRPLGRAGDLDLAVESLDLAPLTPYLASALDARVEQAVLGVKGHATFDASRPEPAWTFRGDVRLDGVRMAEGTRGVEFLRWKSLRLEGVDAAPGRTALASVRLLEPAVRAIVAEDGVRNLDVVARRPRPDPGEKQAPARSPAPSRPGEPEPKWSVGVLQVTKGRASFVDRSVKPPATMDLSDLDLVARGLSSDPRSRAQVRLDARVGGGPLSVAGTLQPRLVGDATDLAIRGKGVDLVALGPYVGKFAGYELVKGKLDVDLRYTVKMRTVEGQNVARIDQFTLGDATNSPDATSLPVKLGLAILTNRDGVIEIDVPVTGSVDDPDFSVGKMVWRAVGNLFTKLVTAPFAALGKLFGGGEGQSLERVEFPPGEAGIDPAADQTLGVLARALRERPALRLEIEGSADEAADGAAIRRTQAREEVRRAKWEALRAKEKGLSLEAVKVEPAEYARWLTAAWKAIPPQPGAAPDGRAQDGKAPPKDPKALPAPEEMEAALAAAASVPPEAYRELAARRADAARERLLAAGDLDPARVFVATGGEGARKEGGAKAFFSLQ